MAPRSIYRRTNVPDYSKPFRRSRTCPASGLLTLRIAMSCGTSLCARSLTLISSIARRPIPAVPAENKIDVRLPPPHPVGQKGPRLRQETTAPTVERNPAQPRAGGLDEVRDLRPLHRRTGFADLQRT